MGLVEQSAGAGVDRGMRRRRKGSVCLAVAAITVVSIGTTAGQQPAGAFPPLPAAELFVADTDLRVSFIAATNSIRLGERLTFTLRFENRASRYLRIVPRTPEPVFTPEPRATHSSRCTNLIRRLAASRSFSHQIASSRLDQASVRTCRSRPVRFGRRRRSRQASTRPPLPTSTTRTIGTLPLRPASDADRDLGRDDDDAAGSLHGQAPGADRIRPCGLVCSREERSTGPPSNSWPCLVTKVRTRSSSASTVHGRLRSAWRFSWRCVASRSCRCAI